MNGTLSGGPRDCLGHVCLRIMSLYLLNPDAVVMAEAEGKDEILRDLADLFAGSYGLDQAIVLEALEERERLGSTGFGRCVAMPHARIDGINRPLAAVIRLADPVDFAAADGLPVELVFGLLSPAQAGASHLQALAAISRLVRDDSTQDALLAAPDAEALFGLVSNMTDRDAA